MSWTDEADVNGHGSLVQQCLRKQPYSTRQHARKAVKRLARERGVELEAYRCRVCERWHLATRKGVST